MSMSKNVMPDWCIHVIARRAIPPNESLTFDYEEHEEDLVVVRTVFQLS